jgi:hypothetical protein
MVRAARCAGAGGARPPARGGWYASGRFARPGRRVRAGRGRRPAAGGTRPGGSGGPAGSARFRWRWLVRGLNGRGDGLISTPAAHVLGRHPGRRADPGAHVARALRVVGLRDEPVARDGLARRSAVRVRVLPTMAGGDVDETRTGAVVRPARTWSGALVAPAGSEPDRTRARAVGPAGSLLAGAVPARAGQAPTGRARTRHRRAGVSIRDGDAGTSRHTHRGSGRVCRLMTVMPGRVDTPGWSGRAPQPSASRSQRARRARRCGPCAGAGRGLAPPRPSAARPWGPRAGAGRGFSATTACPTVKWPPRGRGARAGARGRGRERGRGRGRGRGRVAASAGRRGVRPGARVRAGAGARAGARVRVGVGAWAVRGERGANPLPRTPDQRPFRPHHTSPPGKPHGASRRCHHRDRVRTHRRRPPPTHAHPTRQ